MKKPCVGCGKQIPEAAQHCVFCSAKQPEDTPASSSGEQTTSWSASPSTEPAPERRPSPSAPHSSKAGVTLLGLKVADIEAAIDTREPGEAGAPVSPMVLDPTPQRGLPVVPDPEPPRVFERRAEPRGPSPFSALVRLVMASGGVVLIALFSLPWRGATSWQLLETLAGVDFVRQLYFLAGGAVLCAAALLPVPTMFRAVIGAVVAALPLVLGAEGLLAGWRGFGAALAIVALPATHLVRARHVARLDGRARGLVVAAAIIVGLLYLVPVSQVVPLALLGRMLFSASVGPTVVGLFISIPLVLAALSLLGALGRDLASVAVMLAVLILLWAPAAVLIFVDDGTQLYLALALLWTSATAALCVAQLLSLAGPTTRRA